MTLTRSCRMTWEKGHLLCPRCWSVGRGSIINRSWPCRRRRLPRPCPARRGSPRPGTAKRPTPCANEMREGDLVRLKHGLEGSSVLVPQRNSDNTVTADILLLYTHYYLHTLTHTHTHTHTHTLAHSLSHTYSHTHTQLIRTHTHTTDTGVFYQAR